MVGYVRFAERHTGSTYYHVKTAICWSVKTAGAIEYNWIEGLKRRFALMLCILMMMVCVGYAKQSHGTTVVLLNCERLDGCLDQISEHVDRTV